MSWLDKHGWHYVNREQRIEEPERYRNHDQRL
jgi:hypothetical protein